MARVRLASPRRNSRMLANLAIRKKRASKSLQHQRLSTIAPQNQTQKKEESDSRQGEPNAEPEDFYPEISGFSSDTDDHKEKLLEKGKNLVVGLYQKTKGMLNLKATTTIIATEKD